jgi:hypothetical protein
MQRNEFEILHSEIREHIIEHGLYSRVLISQKYADRLMNIGHRQPDQILYRAEIVEDLEKDYLIIP